MKRHVAGGQEIKPFQPPSGGCMLKLIVIAIKAVEMIQPPSGGCVLKQ